MDDIADLLKGRVPEEPPEMKSIKNYAREQFGAEVGVMVRDRDILITVSSAALAGTLRMRGPDLQRLCRTDKRLVFRIA